MTRLVQGVTRRSPRLSVSLSSSLSSGISYPRVSNANSYPVMKEGWAEESGSRRWQNKGEGRTYRLRKRMGSLINLVIAKGQICVLTAYQNRPNSLFPYHERPKAEET